MALRYSIVASANLPAATYASPLLAYFSICACGSPAQPDAAANANAIDAFTSAHGTERGLLMRMVGMRDWGARNRPTTRTLGSVPQIECNQSVAPRRRSCAKVIKKQKSARPPTFVLPPQC